MGLGFRDLETFNMALLAKQRWRIMTMEHSLVFRILKAKYFSQGNFMNAPIRPTFSYTWRSIAGAREVIKKSCIWRVGN